MQQTLPAYAPLSNRQIVNIEEMADQILAEVGVILQDDPTSLEAMASIGAHIEGDKVFTKGNNLRELISKAPAQFTWHGQNPENDLVIGAGTPVYAPTYGPPVVETFDGQRRQGTLADYETLVKICDRSKLLGTTGYLLTIAHDVPEDTRHMAMARAHLKHSKKPMMGTVISEQALRDVAQEVGTTPTECQLMHMINTTPPLVIQANPLQCLRTAAELGQGNMIESYMMMGATSPVSVIGSLAQGLAEIMVGAALTQIYRAGAPVVAGVFATPFSMQFMGPIFGNPESEIVLMASVQLMRRLGIPCRGDGMITSSKLNDAQAGYEGAGTLTASQISQADLIFHSTGWSEFGRCYNFDKSVADEARILSNL
ncbi:trimethylamine methyltransferase family protein [Roseovarius sp. EL26]|uniref:trimethylamine methyltransferase family protein n=1 Tax=Roseovarius sp. EL26 TaxID=2126672 RepID=UPI000EA13570|nr:trimethylamine methyltransferase family protein [Roseovarius sp. EL26]